MPEGLGAAAHTAGHLFVDSGPGVPRGADTRQKLLAAAKAGEGASTADQNCAQ